MNARRCLAAAILACLICVDAFAQEAKQIPLPAPQMEGGMPLMQALKARRTNREFSDKKLPDQALSNMLWAAWGINRPESNKRTAPSASNRQEMDVYAATADGLFLYDAKANALVTISTEDARAKTGGQPFVATAPVNLIFVADYARMGERASEANKQIYSAADAGYISQNVYLFCASEGLNTVVRAGFDRKALGEALKLRPEQRIILCQTVGYPK